MESAPTYPLALAGVVSAAPVRRTPWVALLALLQAALLVPLAAILNTWTDEEYTLASTAHGIGIAFAKALTFELQAPLYFGILAAWRTFDDSVFFARLFSVLCAVALTFAVAALGKRLNVSRPFVLTWVLVLSPFTTYAALEAMILACKGMGGL